MRRLRSGRTTVDTVGSPVQLLETPLRVLSVHVFPLRSNTGLVAIGGPETRQGATDEAGLPLLNERHEFSEIDTDLSLIWVDAAIAGEGVRWMAVIDDGT